MRMAAWVHIFECLVPVWEGFGGVDLLEEDILLIGKQPKDAFITPKGNPVPISSSHLQRCLFFQLLAATDAVRLSGLVCSDDFR
ncbi:hypothetical protein STEG23_037702 [Scotinomys teguina]